MNIKSLTEALEDLNKQAEISKDALIRDNHNLPNKQALAYKSRKNNGRHYNYKNMFDSLVEWVRDKIDVKDDDFEKYINDLRINNAYISNSNTDSIIMDDGNTRNITRFRKEQ